MIVFVAGMPRAGSMWTYNIVRALLEGAGEKVLPEKIPVDESDLIREALNSEPVDREVYCIKTHTEVPGSLSTRHEVKIICNLRDVRDACLSYMRFMHADYTFGVKVMVSMMELTDYYLNTFRDEVLLVRYDDIRVRPKEITGSVCEYLGIGVGEEMQAEVVEKFSRENVKRKLSGLSGVKVNKKGNIKGAQNKKRYDTVENLDGTYRVFDKNTSFQSNHITSRKDGEWREYFNEEQSANIQSLSRDWLAKHGFSV